MSEVENFGFRAKSSDGNIILDARRLHMMQSDLGDQYIGKFVII